MKPEKAYLGVVLVSYVYIAVALATIWKFWTDPLRLYYLSAVLLAPVPFWLWSVISWTGAEIFAHAKRE
ncbi:LAME_0H07008g1_1 [Lachancea meyersii CBS 8951]|uniref:LAME_0H07008g1_1 n=1 Tax=Lachancea meyersii CBS 8951 TaxID=1266667 RepID=A0A1G4KEW0_9SACH|nr:LAME_0H07008g1_1 [Lachancea meyersii CBS 8951]